MCSLNWDNARLRDIQILKKIFKYKILTSENKNEYQEKYDELVEEEKSILKRFDVII